MLKALRDDVIIQPIYEQKRSTIIIADNAGKFKQYDGEVRGLVISVGPRYPYDVEPGDIVIWYRNEGIKVYDEGKALLIIENKPGRCLQARLARE